MKGRKEMGLYKELRAVGDFILLKMRERETVVMGK